MTNDNLRVYRIYYWERSEGDYSIRFGSPPIYVIKFRDELQYRKDEHSLWSPIKIVESEVPSYPSHT